jgi:hypothetical protein
LQPFLSLTNDRRRVKFGACAAGCKYFTIQSMLLPFNVISHQPLAQKVDDIILKAAHGVQFRRQAKELILGGYEIRVFVDGVKRPYERSWMCDSELEGLLPEMEAWFESVIRTGKA